MSEGPSPVLRDRIGSEDDKVVRDVRRSDPLVPVRAISLPPDLAKLATVRAKDVVVQTNAGFRDFESGRPDDDVESLLLAVRARQASLRDARDRRGGQGDVRFV